MITTREDVYSAINSERDYQDNIIEADPTRCAVNEVDHTVGDYIVMLTTYVREAQEAWTRNGGSEKALHSVRKVAGIAVHCMEDHGAPKR